MKKLAALVLLVFAAACAKSSTSSNSPAPSAAAATTAPAASASAAPSSTTVKVVDNSSKGKILADSTGRTLYVFDKDKTGSIACKDPCTSTWPPLKFTGTGTPTGTSGLATVSRPEGGKQVTYKDRPLYTYSGDSAAGDTNGDGIGGFWHVVKVS